MQEPQVSRSSPLSQLLIWSSFKHGLIAGEALHCSVRLIHFVIACFAGFATKLMPESRTGKRKEHSLDADDLDSVHIGKGSEDCAHAQKHQKQPLAGDAAASVALGVNMQMQAMLLLPALASAGWLHIAATESALKLVLILLSSH